MAHSRRLPYIIIDTNAWITFLCFKADSDSLESNSLNSESIEISNNVAALIDGHESEHIIVMPTAIYVELLGVIRRKGKRPADRLNLINAAVEFLESIDFLFVDLDEEIAREAQDLIAKYELTGIDAAIVASAYCHGVRHVYTSDKRLLKIGSAVPGVFVEVPPPPTTLQFH